MVTGISGGGGTSGLFSRPFSQGSDTFSLSDDNPRNLLQIDPTFREPSTELRIAERRRAEDNPFRDNDNQNANALSNRLRAETFIGEQSIRRLDAEQSDPINLGGSPANVSGGAVTLTSGEQSLEISAEDEARVLENDDDSMTVVNRSTNERVTFNQGDEIDVSGDGNLEITGTQRQVIEGGGETAERITSKTISASDGSTLTVSQSSEGDVSLQNPDSAESVRLGQQKTTVNIQGNSGQEFTFTNDAGRSITFSAGETGSIVTNDDGSVTITNETTGKSEQFTTEQSLNTGGDATASLENEAGAELSFDGTESGQFSTSEDGALELTNTDTIESAAVFPRQEPPQAQRPVRIQTFSDPQTSAASLLQEELISRPDREAREQRQIDQREENEAALRGENNEEESEETSNTSEAEDDSPLAASFREENQDNPFAVDESEQENPFAVEGEQAEDQDNPFAPDRETEETNQSNRNRPNPFSTDNQGSQSPFSGTSNTNQFSNNQLRQSFSAGTNDFSSGRELNLIA